MKRVTVSMSDKLDKALDVLADEWGVTKSNLVTCIVGQYFNGLHEQVYRDAVADSTVLGGAEYMKRLFVEDTTKLISGMKKLRVR